MTTFADKVQLQKYLGPLPVEEQTQFIISESTISKMSLPSLGMLAEAIFVSPSEITTKEELVLRVAQKIVEQKSYAKLWDYIPRSLKSVKGVTVLKNTQVQQLTRGDVPIEATASSSTMLDKGTTLVIKDTTNELKEKPKMVEEWINEIVAPQPEKVVAQPVVVASPEREIPSWLVMEEPVFGASVSLGDKEIQDDSIDIAQLFENELNHELTQMGAQKIIAQMSQSPVRGSSRGKSPAKVAPVRRQNSDDDEYTDRRESSPEVETPVVKKKEIHVVKRGKSPDKRSSREPSRPITRSRSQNRRDIVERQSSEKKSSKKGPLVVEVKSKTSPTTRSSSDDDKIDTLARMVKNGDNLDKTAESDLNSLIYRNIMNLFVDEGKDRLNMGYINDHIPKKLSIAMKAVYGTIGKWMRKHVTVFSVEGDYARRLNPYKGEDEKKSRSKSKRDASPPPRKDSKETSSRKRKESPGQDPPKKRTSGVQEIYTCIKCKKVWPMDEISSDYRLHKDCPKCTRK